jgi:hypothetical protein
MCYKTGQIYLLSTVERDGDLPVLRLAKET